MLYLQYPRSRPPSHQSNRFIPPTASLSMTTPSTSDNVLSHMIPDPLQALSADHPQLVGAGSEVASTLTVALPPAFAVATRLLQSQALRRQSFVKVLRPLTVSMIVTCLHLLPVTLATPSNPILPRQCTTPTACTAPGHMDRYSSAGSELPHSLALNELGVTELLAPKCFSFGPPQR